MKSIISTTFLLFLFFFAGCKKEDTPNSEFDFKTGLSYDPVSFQTVSGAVPMFSGTLPTSFDLTNNMPPIGNQGSQGSCVSWAIAYALKGYQERVENNWTVWDNQTKFSPAFMHNQLRHQANSCDGADFKEALDLLMIQGVCTYGEMPYSEYGCIVQPNSTQKSNAYKYKIKSYLMVNYQKVIDVKSFIYENKPVIIGVEVDESFMMGKKSTSGHFIWKENGTDKVGYHAMVAVGYDDNLNAFKVQNSWGTQWGNAGYCWIDYNWFVKSTIAAIITEDDVTNNGGQTGGAAISISFNDPPTTEIGNTSFVEIEVLNVGDQDLMYDDAELISNNNAFEMSDQINSEIIKPGNKKKYTVKYTPTTEGNHSAVFKIINSNSVAGNTQVTIHAKATLKGQVTVNSLPALNTWTNCGNWSQLQVSHPKQNSREYMTVIANRFKMKVTSINNQTKEVTLEFQLCDGSASFYEDAKVDVVAVHEYKTLLSTGTFLKNSNSLILKFNLSDQMNRPIRITGLVYADNDLLSPTASQYVEFNW